MFSGIFTQSIILFVNGKRIYEALQDCRPDRKKLMLLYLEQLQKEAAPTEHILVAIKTEPMNIRAAALWDRGTVQLRGYLKRSEVGHYPCSMKE
ncbi:hypothetical protein [Microcoleus sp. PH2017_24_DOB_U_A]|uniref:hypothetical protein n=1 Tax=Microcoleus sp. PH2017_24_DOB_U_A TaxID=2798834 RepID=UPI0025F49016|nr:hypothetical protein [Microcoleus sp. PH2017_24_DOB_U_A]